MLVLTRRVNEELLIGDGIRVSVIDIRGKQVRLGIQAPEDMRVLRAELLNRPKPEEVPGEQ